MQILVAALIAVLVILQYLLWVAEDGVRQTYALRVAVQAQTEENETLSERNRALEADIKDLKTGLTAIEERARSEMGMIRQDETFYRLLEEPAPKSAAHDALSESAKPDTPPPTPLPVTIPSASMAQPTTQTEPATKPTPTIKPAPEIKPVPTTKPAPSTKPAPTAKPAPSPAPRSPDSSGRRE